MSKMDAVVKLALFFFVTLLSFSVGTYVGKQVSDAEFKKTALETEPNGRTPSSVEEAVEPQHEAKADSHGEQATEEQSETLTQKELDQLAEEFSHQTEGERSVASAGTAHEEVAPTPKDPNGYKSFERSGKGKDAAKEVVKETTEPVKETAAKEPKKEQIKAKEITTEKTPPSTRRPSSLPSVAESTTGKYTLQVGSFTAEKDAQEKAKDLKAKGWNAFYITADVKGQKWYRLNVGLFSSEKSAVDFKKEFSKETKNNDILIKKITQ